MEIIKIMDMKRICIFVFAWMFFIGCQKAEYMLFNDVARVQMDESEEIWTDFFYTDRSIQRDTVHLTVNTSGYPLDKIREIALEQIPEYDVEYKYDNKGNLIDSVVTEKPNKAIPGVHYVSMDDPEMESLLVIQPNAVTAEVPIILLRDTSLRRNEYRLCLKLVATSDFLLGESEHLTSTIVFSDKLSRPSEWDDWISQYQFGEYSTRKHEFMVEVAGGIRIDDDWINSLMSDMSEFTFWRDKFKESLLEYNNDPDNISQGLAPMRENQDDPNSPLIQFP